MAQQKKQQNRPKQPQDPYALRAKQLTSAVQRLRGWVGSDPARTPELADALVELTEHRLLGHLYGVAPAEAQESVKLAAQLLTANGPIGPYTAVSDARRYVTAVVHLATIQAAAGLVDAAGQSVGSLDELREQLSELPLTEALAPTTVVWALTCSAREALAAGDLARANAYADAALQRLAEGGLRDDAAAAFVVVDTDRLASDVRWAAGRADDALAHLHLAREFYDRMVGERLAQPGRLSPALVQRLSEPLFVLYRDLADRLIGVGDLDLGLVTQRQLVDLLRGLAGRDESARAQLAAALVDLEAQLRTHGRTAEADVVAEELAGVSQTDRAAAAELPPLILRGSAAIEWEPLAPGAAFALATATGSTTDLEEREAALRAETATRLAADRAEAARVEAEQQEAARAAAQRREAERAEAERLAAERAEVERLAAERAEAERAQAERAEAERQAAELEAERRESQRRREERIEAHRLEQERLEAEQRAAEQAELERREAERRAADPAEQERLELERLEAELAELERAEREQAEREQAEREQAEREQAEREQAEREQAEREQAEREQAEREQAEREQAEREQAEREQAEREQAEREQAEREQAARAEAERRAAEEEAARIELERVDLERRAAEHAAEERAKAEEWEARQREEDEREAERAEAARIEAERIEAARIEAERIEAERAEGEAAERERRDREQAEREQAEREEAARVELERIDMERIEAERVEAERIQPALEPELAEPEPVEPRPVEPAAVEDEFAVLQRQWQEARSRGDRKAARALNEQVVELLRPRAEQNLAEYGPRLLYALEELSSARLRGGDLWGSRAPAREAKALAKALGRR